MVVAPSTLTRWRPMRLNGEGAIMASDTASVPPRGGVHKGNDKEDVGEPHLIPDTNEQRCRLGRRARTPPPGVLGEANCPRNSANPAARPTRTKGEKIMPLDRSMPHAHIQSRVFSHAHRPCRGHDGSSSRGRRPNTPPSARSRRQAPHASPAISPS